MDIFPQSSNSNVYIKVDLINDTFHVWLIDDVFDVCEELWLFNDPVRSIDIFNFFRTVPNPIEVLMGLKPWVLDWKFWTYVLYKLFNMSTIAKRKGNNLKSVQKLLCAPFVSLDISFSRHKCEGCLAVYTDNTFCDECERLWNDYHALSFRILKRVTYCSHSDLIRISKPFQVDMNNDQCWSPYEDCNTEVNTWISYDCLVTCAKEVASRYWMMYKNRVYEIYEFNNEFIFKYRFDFNLFSLHGIKSS